MKRATRQHMGAGGVALLRSGSTYRTLTEFATHADSGQMLGAAVTMGAGAAA